MEPEREQRASAGVRGAAAADTGEGEDLSRGRDEEGADSISEMLDALRKEIQADTERFIKQHDQTTMAAVARLVRTQGEQNDAKFAHVRSDVSAAAERARGLERERADMRAELARVSAGLALAERNYPIVGSDPKYDRELDPTLLRIHTKEHVARADMVDLVWEKLVDPAGVPAAEAFLEESADSAKYFTLRFLGGPWLAASRVRDANGCLRGPNGWERLHVKSVAGPMVPVYVSMDESPKMVRLRIEVKKLRDAYSEVMGGARKVYGIKSEGAISIDWTPVVRLGGVDSKEEKSYLLWNNDMADRLNVDKAAVEAAFLAKTRKPEVFWSSV